MDNRASGALRGIARLRGAEARPEGGFTDAYFTHPSEIRPLMEGAGFQTVGLIACEGLVSMIEEKINELSGEPWEAWVELNYRLGKDLSLHGAAEHLLYVGRKPWTRAH